MITDINATQDTFQGQMVPAVAWDLTAFKEIVLPLATRDCLQTAIGDSGDLLDLVQGKFW